MGLQLHKAGVHVGVVMFDLEVTWPPPESNDRIGGYKFLGGEAEAILLISRALGKFEFAMKEAVELNRTLAETGSIDVDALRERAFGQMGQRGMSKELFTQLVKRGGTNIQQLHTIADPWEPNEVLDSPALLVLAPDSMEFATAREINEKFCTQMEVVHGKGSHYNMMQGEQATVQARCVHDFWHRPLGFDSSP
ncbi:Rad54b [Symbiodinium microadriaticum]|nr:Rad54b [Symbiodinium microadriaticum]